MRSRGETSA